MDKEQMLREIEKLTKLVEAGKYQQATIRSSMITHELATAAFLTD